MNEAEVSLVKGEHEQAKGEAKQESIQTLIDNNFDLEQIHHRLNGVYIQLNVSKSEQKFLEEKVRTLSR